MTDTCRNGHPRTEANTTLKGRYKRCRDCYRASDRRRRPQRDAWARAHTHQVVARVRRWRAEADSSIPAPNAGKEWTGPELELVLRPDLALKDVALMLGRTYNAVSTMRRRVRGPDPRYAEFGTWAS